MDALITDLERESEKILIHFRETVSALRTGRATTALVENIQVESYGAVLPLKQVAALSVNQTAMIIVQPWDKALLQPIERAIRDANIGIAPVAEGDLIRLTLPPLTEERRRELLKLLGQREEETKIAFRLARDEVRKKIQNLFNEKKLGEDGKFRLNERLQKVVDAFNSSLEGIAEKKRTEITTI